MILTRWKPLGQVWADMQRLNEEVSRLFERSASCSEPKTTSSTFPTLRIWDDGESVQAEAELPGVELNDLEIFVTGGNQLTIKGERKTPAIEQVTWHRRERGMGTFSRSLTLPVSVDETQITASFSHGALSIKMPKAAASKPRKIPINAV